MWHSATHTEHLKDVSNCCQRFVMTTVITIVWMGPTLGLTKETSPEILFQGYFRGRALTFSSPCITIGMSLCLCGPWFSHVQNGNDKKGNHNNAPGCGRTLKSTKPSVSTRLMLWVCTQGCFGLDWVQKHSALVELSKMWNESAWIGEVILESSQKPGVLHNVGSSSVPRPASSVAGEPKHHFKGAWKLGVGG